MTYYLYVVIAYSLAGKSKTVDKIHKLYINIHANTGRKMEKKREDVIREMLTVSQTTFPKILRYGWFFRLCAEFS